MNYDGISVPLGRAFIRQYLQVAQFGKPHVNSEVGRLAAEHVCKLRGVTPSIMGEVFDAACRGYANEVASVASTIRAALIQNGNTVYETRLYYGTYRLNAQKEREYVQVCFLDLALKDARKKVRSMRAQRDSLDAVIAMMEFAVNLADQYGTATPRAGLAAAGVQLTIYVAQ